MTSAAARLGAPLQRLRHLAAPLPQAAAGAALLLVLALAPLRALLEASMWRHMVLQFPLLLLAGALLAAALPPRARGAVARWNAHGIAGLVGVAGVLAVLMVPRALDLALRDGAIDAAKYAALVLAGAALRLSWRAAGLVVQGFFLGNVLPMTAVVGQLYIDAPLRLCNAYLLDDQARLGNWLVTAAALLIRGAKPSKLPALLLAPCWLWTISRLGRLPSSLRSIMRSILCLASIPVSPLSIPTLQAQLSSAILLWMRCRLTCAVGHWAQELCWSWR